MCGAVSFVAKQVETHAGACHCGMCRRWAGGAFMGVEAGGVEWSGEEHITVYTSSEWGERGFCSQCGSVLFYRFTVAGADDKITLSTGLLDDTEGLVLASEIFIDRKPAFYAFAGERKTMTEAEVMALYAPGA